MKNFEKGVVVWLCFADFESVVVVDFILESLVPRVLISKNCQEIRSLTIFSKNF